MPFDMRGTRGDMLRAGAVPSSLLLLSLKMLFPKMAWLQIVEQRRVWP